MNRKNILTSLIIGASLLSFSVIAEYKVSSKSNVGQISSINMIPTQAQYVVLNTSKIEKKEELEKLISDVKSFDNFKGSISKFLSSKGIIKKYKLSASNKGSNQINVKDLKAYEAKGKNIYTNIIKKDNSIDYSLSIKFDEITGSESGKLSLGRNEVKIGNGYILLISYKNI